MEGSAFCNRCGSRIVSSRLTRRTRGAPRGGRRNRRPAWSAVTEPECQGKIFPMSALSMRIPSDPIRDALAAEAGADAPEFQFVNEQPEPAPAKAPAKKSKKFAQVNPSSPGSFRQKISPRRRSTRNRCQPPRRISPKKPEKPKNSAGWRPGRRTVIAHWCNCIPGNRRCCRCGVPVPDALKNGNGNPGQCHRNGTTPFRDG